MSDLSSIFDKIEEDYVASYKGIDWKNNVTPLNADNLNTMDLAIIHAMKQCSYINSEVDRVEKETQESLDNLEEKVDDNYSTLCDEIKRIDDDIDALSEKTATIQASVNLNSQQITDIKNEFTSHCSSSDEALRNMEEKIASFKSFSAEFDNETGTLILS